MYEEDQMLPGLRGKAAVGRAAVPAGVDHGHGSSIVGQSRRRVKAGAALLW